MRHTLCFDDVLLEPQYSEIESRKSIDLSVKGLFSDTLTCPIVGSPMDTVMGSSSAATLALEGGFGIIHRYCSIEEAKNIYRETKIKLFEHVLGTRGKDSNVMMAVGATGDFLERTTELYNDGCREFCIDVAHGHHLHVKNALTALRNKFGHHIHVMTGNVATLSAFNDLADWGSDSIRVGVGGGSLCTTRIMTGHGIPTLHSVMDCARSKRKALIVADGGIRNSGDAVKALAAGAHLVMLGSVLAGHDESPGDLVDVNGDKITEQTHPKMYRKNFRGMASREAQLNWRGNVSVVEGESTLVPYRGSLNNTLKDFLDGVKSGLSYSGARNIEELHRKARFVTISSNGTQENGAHRKR